MVSFKRFLKVVCASALVASCLAGCTSNPTDSEEVIDSQETAEEVITSDIIIVGGGTSGLNAAIFASEEGANVVLIEKLGVLGGSNTFSSGALYTCNSNGLIDGDDSVETALNVFKGIAELGDKESGYPNYERLEAMLSETGNTVNKLVDLGVVFGRTLVAPTISAAIVDGGGAGYTSFLTQIAKDKNVNIYTNTTAKELIVEDNRVVGVKAVNGDKNLKFTADSVILASGGYSLSDEKISKYAPETTMVYNGRACVGNTGDGIDMALAVGAVEYENQWLMVSTTMPEATYNNQAKANTILSLGTSLAVDSEGNRFLNEAPAAYSEFGNVMIGKEMDNCFALMNSTEETLEVLDAGMELNEVVHASSISELASLLNMDANTLQVTFARYNELCENGEDTDFNKAAVNLISLDENDIYAVKYYPTSIGTIGGIKTNIDCEVLRADGSIIDGLYAVGEMSNREFYNYYYVGGASLGIYSTMGRLTGTLAAQRALEK